MKTPEFITFTGIDDKTDLRQADELAQRYPIEWGILFCDNSRDARFPSLQTVHHALEISGAKCAHLCGRDSRNAQVGVFDIPVREFDRIQINGYNINTDHLPTIENIYGVKVILQTRSNDFSDSPFYQLFDKSGGLGKLPETIPDLPDDSILYGYSGGIGPNTVESYISKISNDGRFWIDMEGQIRTDDWLDLDKVEQVCKKVFPNL